MQITSLYRAPTWATPEQFVGAWKLISWVHIREMGTAYFPMGKDALGHLVYSKDGHVSVSLMNSERKPFFSPALFGGTGEEKSRAYESYISYSGRYFVEANKIIHVVELSLFPNWVGTRQERIYEFEGDRLILTSPPFEVNEHKLETARLIWQRT